MKRIADGHYVYEQYRERMTRKEWKEILLNGGDTPIVCGLLRQIKARSLGSGIVELYKIPAGKEYWNKNYKY